MRAEDPDGVAPGKVAIGWGSDALAELRHRLDLRYLALVPGSSYRGRHDSLMNYTWGNSPARLASRSLNLSGIAVRGGDAVVVDVRVRPDGYGAMGG